MLKIRMSKSSIVGTRAFNEDLKGLRREGQEHVLDRLKSGDLVDHICLLRYGASPNTDRLDVFYGNEHWPDENPSVRMANVRGTCAASPFHSCAEVPHPFYVHKI